MSYEQNRLVAPTVQLSRASKCASAVLFYHFKGMERRASDATMLSFKRALIWSTRQSGLLPTMQWPAGLHPPRISFILNQVHLVTLHSCSFSIDTQHAAATAGRQRAMKLSTSSNCPTQAQHTNQRYRGGFRGAQPPSLQPWHSMYQPTLEGGCRGAQPPSLQSWHRMYKSTSLHVTCDAATSLTT